MTDITADTPATLYVSDAPSIAAAGLQRGQMVKEGALGELITDVISTDPAEQWRYRIATDSNVWLRADQAHDLAKRFNVR